MNNNKYLTNLFHKYLNQQTSEAELEEILHYFQLSDHDDFLIELIEQELNKNAKVDVNLVESIGDNIAKNLFAQTKPKKILTIRKLLPYVAAAVVLVVAGIVFFDTWMQSFFQPSLVENNMINPGTNRATIRLSNGDVFNLDEGQGVLFNNGEELKYGDGTRISNLEDSQDVTISVPRSGHYAVTLSDGTKVWLNSESMLTYPSRFDTNNRTVWIVGEAYFEVAHDANRPFVVKTQRDQVAVLGTKFNVHAYPDDNSQHVTLVDGEVEVKDLTTQAKYKLKPGQQAIRKMSSAMHVIKVDPQEYVAWKDGVIVLQGYDLGEIFLQLGRWYDVDFDEVPESIKADRLYGILRRDVPLNDVLQTIKDNYKTIDFSIKGRRVMMSSK